MITQEIIYKNPHIPEDSLHTILGEAKQGFISTSSSLEKNVTLMTEYLSKKLKEELGGKWFVVVCEPETFSCSMPHEENKGIIFRLSNEQDGNGLDYIITKLEDGVGI